MASYIPAKKNLEYIFYVGLTSQADTKLLQNNPTLAAGDVLVSTDGGATSNLDTLPAVTPASSDIVKVTVSADEMNGDNVIIVFSDAAGDEWCDLLINIQTAGQTFDTMDTNIDDIETDTNAIETLVKASGDGDLAAILTDTNEIQGKLPANKFMGSSDGADDDGTLNAITAAGPTKAEMDTAHGLLATPAQVNEQVVDCLGTDTLSELSQGIPASTPTIKAALMLIYMALRNQLTTTSDELAVYNDAGTKIAKKALSDDDTTYTEGKMASGA